MEEEKDKNSPTPPLTRILFPHFCLHRAALPFYTANFFFYNNNLKSSFLIPEKRRPTAAFTVYLTAAFGHFRFLSATRTGSTWKLSFTFSSPAIEHFCFGLCGGNLVSATLRSQKLFVYYRIFFLLSILIGSF